MPPPIMPSPIKPIFMAQLPLHVEGASYKRRRVPRYPLLGIWTYATRALTGNAGRGMSNGKRLVQGDEPLRDAEVGPDALRLLVHALHELFPHALGGLAQDEVRVRVEHVPEPALELRAQLA